MCGAVPRRHVTILSLDQQAAMAINKNGAERMIAMGRCATGHVKRPPQKMLVKLGRAQVNATNGLPCGGRFPSNRLRCRALHRRTLHETSRQDGPTARAI